MLLRRSYAICVCRKIWISHMDLHLHSWRQNEKKIRKFASFFDKCMSLCLLALQKRCCGLFCFEISKHDLTSNFSACYFVSRLQMHSENYCAHTRTHKSRHREWDISLVSLCYCCSVSLLRCKSSRQCFGECVNWKRAHKFMHIIFPIAKPMHWYCYW